MTTTVRISDADVVANTATIFMIAARTTAAGQTEALVDDLSKIPTKNIFTAVLAAGCEEQSKKALINVLIRYFTELNKSLSGVEKKHVAVTTVPTEKPAEKKPVTVTTAAPKPVAVTTVPTEKPAEKKPATKPFVWADAVDDVAVTEVKVVAVADPTDVDHDVEVVADGDHEVDDDTAVTESTETDVADDGSTGWTPARTRQLKKKLAKEAKAVEQPTTDGKQTDREIDWETHDGLVADEYHSVPPPLPAGHEKVQYNKLNIERQVTSAHWFFGGKALSFQDDLFAWSWKLTANRYSKPWGWSLYKGNYNRFKVTRDSPYVHVREADGRWSHYRVGPDGTLIQVTVKEVIDYFTPEAFRKGRA